MSLHAEHLPREIWLHIFTFLEGHDVARAFSYLNSFFNLLLRSPHLQLHIRIKQNEAYERLPQLTWAHVKLQNIYSLSVGQRRANCLIQFLRWHAQYLIRLRALSIYLREINLYHKVQFITIALQQIPSLEYVRIKYIGLHTHSFSLNPILIHIFGKQSIIKRCFFNFNWLNCDVETSQWSENSNLKHLNIQEISWQKLFSILSFTPQLCSLKTDMDVSRGTADANFTLSQLRKLNLKIFNPPFAQLEIFKQIAPNIQYLRLRGNIKADNDNYFKEKLWQKLFYNIEYFDVRLYIWEYTSQEIQVLRKHIQNCQGKEWFTWEEKDRRLTATITFKSLISNQV